MAGIGAAAGAATGIASAVATGGVSTIVPAAIGAAQTIAGLIKKKKADAMMPSPEDKEQRAMQRLLARRRRAYETGTAGNADRSALRQAMQSGISNSFKYGAGSRGLNAMNQMYQQGIFGINQQGSSMAANYAQQEGALVNEMAQRRLDIQMTKYDREQARAAQLMTEGKQNLGAALMKGLKLDTNPMTVTKPTGNGEK